MTSNHTPPKEQFVSLDKEKFIRDLHNVANEIQHISVAKGFEDPDVPRNDLEMLMLIVSEVSEMVEALRDPNYPTLATKKGMEEYTLLEEEAADVLIRLLQYCASRKLRIGKATLSKIECNRNRAAKHGGKRF